jgi:histone acetyltransferase (RNA polymerase elongator complex component)
MIPKRRIIPVFIPHQGCKHECVFCNQRQITGAAKSATTEEVQAACALAPFPAELAFYGGSFTAIPEAEQNGLLEAALPFLELDQGNSIRISTRPDCVDGATLSRLKSYGVRTVELGAQSMCDDVLHATRRGHDASDISHAAGCVKNAGLSLILQMMTGLPCDTSEKSVYTAKALAALQPDGVRIYPTVVVRGTELYQMWKRGDYEEHTIAEAVCLCAELCLLFWEAGIPVIRIGMNPSDELSAGGAAAGAYHPSLGELVYSKVYHDKAAALLCGVAAGSDITLTVAKGCVSKMLGHRRESADALKQRFSLRSLRIVEGNVKPGEVSVHDVSLVSVIASARSNPEPPSINCEL